jgi:hypothetical protein
VTLSLGELLPEYGKRQVYLATEIDGAPLAENQAPARLVVLDEEKPSRSLHGIASVTVFDLSRLDASIEHGDSGARADGRQRRF